MKISKLILACLVGGMAGNIFAESTKISCTVKSVLLGKNTYEIEFDDNDRQSILVNGDDVKYSAVGNYSSWGEDRAKLLDFDNTHIVFMLNKYTVGSHHDMVSHEYYFTIDREDGSMKFDYEKPFQGVNETSYGKCVKAEDVVRKF
ncbi:hypothetical protein MKI79_06515 [Acinetobacter sp. A3.8]|uniref:Uncharacterized protein n=1 Tax=Acinetobacter sedimenti TaxID=2919922 RepID=A0A9X1WWP7_9GAMM|nr:hypothetical protein [Acinetobacter sedimenti]MCJ8146554.1 hypothetical protein [Acinetobacter sedimenti]